MGIAIIAGAAYATITTNQIHEKKDLIKSIIEQHQKSV